MKKRKLLIVYEPEPPLAHAGIALAEQLVDRIRARQEREGMLAIESSFWSGLDMLRTEKDEFDALSSYSPLSEWVDSMVSRDRHRARESLRRFLESKP